MEIKIKKILIANRGEIACRIIQTCKENNIISVAVFSDADADALHVKLADESYYIGESTPKESYLNMDKIIDTALRSNCDAIHPGYGFLSENWLFNKKVGEAGLIFIGPNFESMRLLGSKTESRDTMILNKIPVIPGWKSVDAIESEYYDAALKIGFPVIIKAAAGGGGKGMRIVRIESEFYPSLQAAKREAMSAFGSDEVFIEKYIVNPRHIEFQVVGDKYGNYIHLNERECSIQRRHQKIIEETPSTALNEAIRSEMGQIAIEVCKAAGYDSIGTVEFLLDKDSNFYFLEVNARLQVEHTITEETTGIDLVKLQIGLAEGKALEISQSDVNSNGHAIECRIYAEDANNNFMPSAGKILFFREPKGKGIRYDSGIYQNFEVPVNYDPIMAKLIVKGNDREEARKKMIFALQNNVILGVANSIPYLINILNSELFVSGQTFTDTIDINQKNFIANDVKFLKQALVVAADSIGYQNTISDNNFRIPEVWELIGKWQICNF